MSLLLLYFEFFKLGLFAVGGGLATLPFLFHMTQDHFTFIQKTGWLTSEQVGNFLAIAQCSPGAIGVNVAAQTGYQYGGPAGGILASLGLISPAIIIIAAIAKVLQSLRENKITSAVFSGLRPAAAGLLCAAGFNALKLALYNPESKTWYTFLLWKESIVCAVIFLLLAKFRKHPVIYIAAGAAAGILLGL